MLKGISRKQCLVVVRCDFSRWPESITLKRAQSGAIANSLEEIFASHVAPMIQTADAAGAEIKGLVDNLSEKLNLSKRTVTASYLEENSVIKRGHKQIVDTSFKFWSIEPEKCPNRMNAVLWVDCNATR